MPVTESILREIVREELSAVLAASLDGIVPRRPQVAAPWRPWMPVFLRSLYEHAGDVLKACAAVRPARSTVYAWRERCPRFAAAWDRIVAVRELPSRPAWESLKTEILPAAVLQWPDTPRREETA